MTHTETLGDVTPVAPPPSPSRSRWRSVGVLAALVAVIVVLLAQGLLHSLNYFETVDQVLAQRHAIGVKEIRLEGVVVPHTIDRTSSGASFTLVGSPGRTVRVIAHGSPPGLFQADIPVVVVGHFTTPTSLVFDGSQIMVKHSATYIAEHPGRVRAPNGSVR